MSFLVRLPQDTYREDALKQFTVDSEFTLGNAQAMSGFQPVLVSAKPAFAPAAPRSHTGFDDQLGRHFERKTARVSTASSALAK